MTGLVRGYGLVFHIVKNQRPYDLLDWSHFPFLELGFTARLGLPRIDCEVQSPLRNDVLNLTA